MRYRKRRKKSFTSSVTLDSRSAPTFLSDKRKWFLITPYIGVEWAVLGWSMYVDCRRTSHVLIKSIESNVMKKNVVYFVINQ